MKQKTFLKVFSPVFALSIILSGCGSNSQNSEKTATKAKVDFKVSADNKGEGGVFSLYALIKNNTKKFVVFCSLSFFIFPYIIKQQQYNNYIEYLHSKLKF